MLSSNDMLQYMHVTKLLVCGLAAACMACVLYLLFNNANKPTKKG